MKIRYRITLLFTVVVTLILFIVCLSIYYLSYINADRDFKKRLKSRALTSVNILLKLEGITNDMVKKIDETSASIMQDKSIVVYDNQYKEIYFYTQDNASVIRADSSLLKKASLTSDYVYTPDYRKAIVFLYVHEGKTYTTLAAAADINITEKLTQLRFVLLVTFFSGAFITFVSGLFFSTNFLAPIKKLTNEVKEISSQNLSRRIDVARPKDELNELATTFNDLLTRLEESFAIQRRFITNASHELSTPLTSISSQLEITLQKERNVPEYQSVLFSVYEDVKNLTQLTRSLLEIAKASGTSDGMELSLVRIDELLMKLKPELKKIDSRFHVDLHFETFPENENDLLVFGNTDLLYIAIKNIVVNACKFAPDHTASVSLQFTENQLHVLVKDNGPGVSEEEKNLVFQPFYRSASTNDIHGFGLGLSLASRIIKLHKGTIELLSEASKETVFTIHLPIAGMFHKIV